MADVVRWRIHMIFNADQLARPSSFRTDVWAISPADAWVIAESMFDLMVESSGMTGLWRSRMSCVKELPNLQGESPEAPYVAALRGPGERGK